MSATFLMQTKNMTQIDMYLHDIGLGNIRKFKF